MTGREWAPRECVVTGAPSESAVTGRDQECAVTVRTMLLDSVL